MTLAILALLIALVLVILANHYYKIDRLGSFTICMLMFAAAASYGLIKGIPQLVA